MKKQDNTYLEYRALRGQQRGRQGRGGGTEKAKGPNVWGGESDFRW